MPPTWFSVLRDATIVVVISAGVALGANALRSSGSIPLVAEQEYEILVPCPEFEGKPAASLSPEKVRAEEGTLLVDARDREDYDAWHLPGAISIPYDYLEPKPEEKKVLRSHARKVVVYGDGDEPDSGQQLANAISGKGVKNVFYVKGGAPALRAQERSDPHDRKRGGK
jgi:rhodanese-related sulfurtransferase